MFQQVSENDALPKTVCIDCWHKTEEFHEFHRFVKSAQTNYLNNTIKIESLEEFELVNVQTDVGIKPMNFVEVIPSDNVIEQSFEENVTIVKSDELNEMNDESNSVYSENDEDNSDEGEFNSDESGSGKV